MQSEFYNIIFVILIFEVYNNMRSYSKILWQNSKHIKINMNSGLISDLKYREVKIFLKY